MRKTVLMLLLVISSHAVAEWVKVGGNRSLSSYADLSTVRKSGDMVKMWSLTDFRTADVFADTVYLSAKAHEEYDCKEEKKRMLAYSFHSGNMGGGVVVYAEPDPDDKWAPIPSGSTIATLWKVACGKP